MNVNTIGESLYNIFEQNETKFCSCKLGISPAGLCEVGGMATIINEY